MNFNNVVQAESIPVLDRNVISELVGMLGAEGFFGLAQRMFAETEEALASFTLPQNEAEFISLKERSHKLAGSAATLGAKRMHQILKALETSCKLSDAEEAQQALDALPGNWAATKAAMSDPSEIAISA